MPYIPKWRRVLRFWRPDVAADVDDELRFHFEARTSELVALGTTPDAARRQALEEFGDVDEWRQRLHAIGTRMERRRERAAWWHRLLGDARHTLRGLRNTPRFTVGIVLTVALTLAATSAMYGVMRRLLLERPPHVGTPEHLVKLYFRYERPELTGDDAVRTVDLSSFPFFERLRDDHRVLESVATYTSDEPVPVGIAGEARTTMATLVSAGFWHTLHVTPAVGRFFDDGESHPATGARVAVLGHALWQQRFAGDRAIVGRAITVKGVPYTIVGVAPRGFRGTELHATDLWLPLFAEADGSGRAATWHTFAGSSNLHFVARLRPSVDARGVAAYLSQRYAAFVDESRAGRPSRPGEPRLRASVRVGALTGALGSDMKRLPEANVSLWLVGIAAMLLAVACANVAGLLLLRAHRRRREFALRASLGMTHRRMAGLLLVESAMLVVLGAAAAALLMAIAGPWIDRTLLANLATERPGIDWQTVGVAAACVTFTIVVTALAPMLHVGRGLSLHPAGGGPSGATQRLRTQNALLVVQTALCVVLLVGAGLFLRSVRRIATLDLGLDPYGTLGVQADFRGSGRSGRDIVAFHERALERVRALPGVAHASLATNVPLHQASGIIVRLSPSAEWLRPERVGIAWNQVSDDFFAATGMRLVAGRAIVAADRGGPPVAVVNEALATFAWHGRSPIGECIYLSSSQDTCTRVVGIVRNARSFRLREVESMLWVYVPLDAADVDDRVLLVRPTPGFRHVDATIARSLRALDPSLPFVDVQVLGDVLDPQMRPWRIGAAVFTAFGLLAALLAALGLYSAVAYAVAQRTREIGVRVALGAPARSVLRLVAADGTRIATLGVGIGLLVAVLAAPKIAALLFDTSPRDPLVLGVVGGAALLLALLAALAPARRAARVDPARVLHVE